MQVGGISQIPQQTGLGNLSTMSESAQTIDQNGPVSTQLSDYKIIRRNGSVVAFEPAKISIAMTKAFLAVNGGQGAACARIRCRL